MLTYTVVWEQLRLVKDKVKKKKKKNLCSSALSILSSTNLSPLTHPLMFCSSSGSSSLHHVGLLLQYPVFLHNMVICSWALLFLWKSALFPFVTISKGFYLENSSLSWSALSYIAVNSTTHIPISPLDPELSPLVTAAETAAPLDPDSSLPVNYTSRERYLVNSFITYIKKVSLVV